MEGVEGSAGSVNGGLVGILVLRERGRWAPRDEAVRAEQPVEVASSVPTTSLAAAARSSRGSPGVATADDR